MDKEMSNTVKDSMLTQASSHKQAIKTEMTRRKDKKDEAERKRNAAAEAQSMRREHRRCLIERLRIKGVETRILDLIDFAEKTEYSSQFMVSDIRDYKTEEE